MNRATVLSEGPFKGRSIEAEADALLLPIRPFAGDRPLSTHDTNPHRLLPITLFGRHFVVWVLVDVPDYQLPEYVASQLMNPLGLGLWREGEPIDGRAEQEGDRPGAGTHEEGHQAPNRADVQHRAYRPDRVPEARGVSRPQTRHHGPGSGSQVG